MASNFIKTPIFRTATRSFAAEASAQRVPVAETKFSVLSNRVALATNDNGSGLSRVSVNIRAGSRNEKGDNVGTTNVLRSAAGLSTKNFTSFGIIRNIQQLGGSLYVTSDRETISYNLVITRNNVDKALPYLRDVATQQVFKPWEISDNIPRLKYELSLTTPQIRAIDLAHQAAYRTGLGNSLFIRKDLIGKVNSETLAHYVNENFVANRTSVVAVNVDEAVAKKLGESLALNDGKAEVAPSPYRGGEIRKDKALDLAHVAIVGEGAGLADQKHALAFAILKGALGSPTSVKWGTGVSPLAKSSDGNNSVAAAINVSYGDSGLFGVFISAEANAAGQTVEAAVKALRAGHISESDLKRGKALLRTSLLNRIESSESLAEDLTVQTQLLGTVLPNNVLADAISTITLTDVNAAAKKIASGKLSIGAIGNLKTVPHVDQLN